MINPHYSNYAFLLFCGLFFFTSCGKNIIPEQNIFEFNEFLSTKDEPCLLAFNNGLIVAQLDENNRFIDIKTGMHHKEWFEQNEIYNSQTDQIKCNCTDDNNIKVLFSGFNLLQELKNVFSFDFVRMNSKPSSKNKKKTVLYSLIN